MAGPLKISARVEIDASQAKVGAREAAEAVQAISPAADKAAVDLGKVSATGSKIAETSSAVRQAATAITQLAPAAAQAETALQRLINTSVGLHSGPANQNLREWAGALANEGMQLDRLRAKYNPLFSVISSYRQSLTEIRTAHAMGALSADEMTAAISRQRQAALASIDAIKGRNRALAEGSFAGGGAGAFQTANIAAQFQDIAVTSAMGSSPLQIGLQQGTQLAGVFAQMGSGRQVVAGLAAAFTSIISPVSLATIGLTAAAAAAVQYGMSTEEETSKVQAALEGHAELVRRIREAWPQAAEGAKEYARESQTILAQQARDSINTYKQAVSDAVADARAPLEGLFVSDFGGRTFVIDQVQAALSRLDQSIAAQKPNLRGFVDQLIEIENQQGTPENIREIIRSIREASTEGLEAQSKLASLQGTMAGIGVNDGQIASIRALTAALSDLSKIGMKPLSEVEQIDAAYRKAISNARDREERDDAIRARDAARLRVDNNNPFVTGVDGVPVAVPVPQQKPSALDGDPDTKAQKAKDAYRDLVRSASDRVAQMQLEASLAGQTGVAVEALRFRLELLQKVEADGAKATPEQLKMIEEKSAAYREYAEAAAQAGLRAQLEFEQQQLARSAIEQEIANRQKAAGLAVDMNSYEAALIRANERMKESKEIAGDFVKTLISGLRDGKNLWDALGNAALNVLSKIAQKMLEDQIASIFGGGTGAQASGGGIGSITSLVQGLFKQTAAAAPAAANINAPSGSGEALAWSFWKSKGLADHQVAGILGHIKGESGFNPLAVGDGGKALGLYQHNDRAPSLLAAIGGRGNLGNELAQHRFAYQELMGPENRAWNALLASKDVRGATSAFAGFERPSGFTWANPEGSHNFAGRLSGAEEALRKFGGTAGLATQNLGGFGAGLGKMGQSLTNVFPAAPAAPGGGFFSGLGGFFSSLFGGTPAGPQASFILGGGGFPGLFDTGGFTGMHPTDSIAGFVHGQEFVVKADVTRKPGVRQFLQALNDNKLPGFASGGFVPGGAPLPASGLQSRPSSSSPDGMKVYVNNYGGAKVETREETGADGQRFLHIELDKQLASLLQDDASRTARAMKSTFGSSRKVERK